VSQALVLELHSLVSDVPKHVMCMTMVINCKNTNIQNLAAEAKS